MIRTALLLSSLLLAAPAVAGAPHFQAEPLAKPAEARLVLRDTLWNCGDTACGAAASASRPAIVCAVLAREVGALRSFTVKGEALSAAELDRCNSRARKDASGAVRTAAK